MSFFPVYAFDLDGTLYRGAEVIPGSVEAVQELVRAGSRVLYVTNNSSQTVAAYVEKLTKMGFPATPEQILTSATAATQLCQERRLRSVFVVGEPGLLQTLSDGGIHVVNPKADQEVTSNSQIDAVVCGICRTHLSYGLLDTAMQLIRGGAEFIATNADKTYPMEGDRLCPGAGTMVVALTACTGVEPLVAGKPNPAILTNYLTAHGLAPQNLMMVGDRMDTDIECGLAAGCEVGLVLTGVSTSKPTGIPTFASVAELVAGHRSNDI
jgi:4-nitrophenyl phosphatase